MAKIAPFAGWRYNRQKFPSLAEVVVPPYDVISDEGLKVLQEKNPYNFSRIILPGGENKHQKAADLFHGWQKEKVFVQDPGLRLYFYKQKFRLKPQELFCQKVDGKTTLSRTGILCRVHVEDYSAKIILPHEKTFSGPKADRYLLMEAAQGNMEPVFLGYDSPLFSGDSFAEIIGALKPEVTFLDSESVTHEMWPMGDERIHNEVQNFLEDLKFYILDGHHRYETALKFYKDHQKDGRPSLGYALANICSFKQPGTVILPTHRAVKGLPVSMMGSLEEKLKKNWAIKKDLDLKQVEDVMIEAQTAAFGIKMLEGKYWTLSYNGRQGDRLDLEILHGELLPFLAEGNISEEQISYIKDIKELEERVDRGEFQMGILVKPSSCTEVMTVAEHSKVMPHKSTFFYPKIPSGLVVNLFE